MSIFFVWLEMVARVHNTARTKIAIIVWKFKYFPDVQQERRHPCGVSTVTKRYGWMPSYYEVERVFWPYSQTGGNQAAPAAAVVPDSKRLTSYACETDVT